MTSVHRTALLPYTAMQMYDIVNDVESYPEYLPWCAGSKLLMQSETSMQASILMKKGPLNHSFSTRNDMIPGEQIHIELVNGPFKHLSGDWHFHHLGEQGSKIELKMSFEFSNILLNKLVGPVFTQIANSLVDAFCQRAHQLYRHNT